jgi:hypothetical protein
VYGQTRGPPRPGPPGRPRHASTGPLDEGRYAIVGTRRARGRVVEVPTPGGYGTPERRTPALAASPGWRGISTGGGARHTWTSRQQARRRGRHGHAGANDQADREAPWAWSVAYDPWVVPHLGWRHRLAPPRPTNGSGSPTRGWPRTPAMAAGVTDHIWTMDARVSVRAPPRCVGSSTPHRPHGGVPHSRDTIKFYTTKICFIV